MNGDSKGWAVLMVAGLMEVAWAICMDYSEGFTNVFFGVAVVVFLVISMILLSKALNLGLPVGTAYAVWTGIGAVGTITVSLILGNESATPLRLMFVAFIIGGIIGLQVTSHKKEENP